MIKKHDYFNNKQGTAKIHQSVGQKYINQYGKNISISMAKIHPSISMAHVQHN